ncbi:MAG: hypothetical protein ACTSW1_06520 [Candidatus Hodarchaeales archaeon]
MNEEIISELKAIKRLLSIANSSQLDAYLDQLITTSNRRKIWIAINGQRLQNDIAEEVGVSQMAVSKFLKILTDAKLIEYKQYSPPTKIIDYIPAPWLAQADNEE